LKFADLDLESLLVQYAPGFLNRPLRGARPEEQHGHNQQHPACPGDDFEATLHGNPLFIVHFSELALYF
jgi:hypothetical protein